MPESRSQKSSESNRPVMRMQWCDLLFMHWPVSVDVLRRLIPESLEIETFDGQAWVGLVPFTMRDVLPAFVPGTPWLADIPAVSAFHECNVRTYVRPRGIQGAPPGVWFFSLDAMSRLAVWGARRFFRLQYFRAAIEMTRRDNEFSYSLQRQGSPRAAMRCSWRVGEAMARTQPGELAHFLTERYALYTVNRRGELRLCRIHHEPWPLRHAELLSLEDRLVEAAGIPVPQGTRPVSVLHGADALNVKAWPLERV